VVAFLFDLAGLAHDGSAGDVLYRPLHNSKNLAAIAAHAQHLAGITLTNYFLDLPGFLLPLTLFGMG